MTKGNGELVEYLDKKFQATATKKDVAGLKADTYFQEMLMLARKVDRHEKWLQQIAEKVGVKLEY